MADDGRSDGRLVSGEGARREPADSSARSSSILNRAARWPSPPRMLFVLCLIRHSGARVREVGVKKINKL